MGDGHASSASCNGTYTQSTAEKEARLAAQWSAWEKQKKDVAHLDWGGGWTMVV